jgi:hypothetical protein
MENFALSLKRAYRKAKQVCIHDLMFCPTELPYMVLVNGYPLFCWFRSKAQKKCSFHLSSFEFFFHFFLRYFPMSSSSFSLSPSSSSYDVDFPPLPTKTSRTKSVPVTTATTTTTEEKKTKPWTMATNDNVEIEDTYSIEKTTSWHSTKPIPFARWQIKKLRAESKKVNESGQVNVTLSLLEDASTAFQLLNMKKNMLLHRVTRHCVWQSKTPFDYDRVPKVLPVELVVWLRLLLEQKLYSDEFTSTHQKECDTAQTVVEQWLKDADAKRQSFKEKDPCLRHVLDFVEKYEQELFEDEKKTNNTRSCDAHVLKDCFHCLCYVFESCLDMFQTPSTSSGLRGRSFLSRSSKQEPTRWIVLNQTYLTSVPRTYPPTLFDTIRELQQKRRSAYEESNENGYDSETEELRAEIAFEHQCRRDAGLTTCSFTVEVPQTGTKYVYKASELARDHLVDLLECSLEE